MGVHDSQSDHQRRAGAERQAAPLQATGVTSTSAVHLVQAGAHRIVVDTSRLYQLMACEAESRRPVVATVRVGLVDLVGLSG